MGSSSIMPFIHKQKVAELQELATALIRNGYNPIWLSPGTKVPGRTGWGDHLSTLDSVPQDFCRVGNIGLMQGVVGADKTFGVVIDIDLDDHALISCVQSAVGAPCPQKRAKKGVSFVLRGIGEIRSQTLHDYRTTKRPAGDILAKGKQTVIPPSTHPEGMPYQWVTSETPLNTPYNQLPIIDESAIKEIRAFLRNANNPIANLNVMTWNGINGGGDTHDICLAAVGAMVADDWTDEQIHARIRRAKREACERAGERYDWPGEAKAYQEWIDSAREKGFGKRPNKAKLPSRGELANLVLAKHGAVIRRDKARRDWCVYNGKLWEEGATEEAKTLIRLSLPDEQVMRSTIDGVESVMRLYPSITVGPDAWDADKHYLNCPDGTYNLKTGERMDHDPAHFITRMTRVSPRFDYENSTWVKAMKTWFVEPAEIEYIQTQIGLCLTGETRDECVIMWIGKSRAGKSKITEIINYVMGDYVQTATDTAFLEVRYHPHQEEVARMRGKRLVFIHEVEGHLNLRRVKSMASGEGVSASFKGKDRFEFKPEAKLWFVGNEAPPTKSSGGELQRRLYVYEFERQIDEKDVDIDLPRKLKDEAEYVLGWMIDGSRLYYTKGLHRSPHVIASTKRYFAESDIMEQWIDDNCVVEAGAVTAVASLFSNFDLWADTNGVRFKPDKGRFSQRLKAKGYRLDRKVLAPGDPAVRVVLGLRLSFNDGPGALF